MKKTIASLGAIAMSAAMATTAFAATVSNNTGSQSSVSTNISSDMSTTVSNMNSAEIVNYVDTRANSGWVKIESGHGDVTGINVQTGNSTANTTVTTEANAIDSTVNDPACGCSGTNSTVNNTTGSQSSVSTTLSNTDGSTTTNGNMAAVGNFVGGSASAGKITIRSWHGDVKNATVMTGTTMGTTSVGTSVNYISSVVMR